MPCSGWQHLIPRRLPCTRRAASIVAGAAAAAVNGFSAVTAKSPVRYYTGAFAKLVMECQLCVVGCGCTPAAPSSGADRAPDVMAAATCQIAVSKARCSACDVGCGAQDGCTFANWRDVILIHNLNLLLWSFDIWTSAAGSNFRRTTKRRC